jgi:hypothetical protein
VLVRFHRRIRPVCRVGKSGSFGGVLTTSSTETTTHRLLVRSDIADPQHELRSGMFANFVFAPASLCAPPPFLWTAWCARVMGR